VPEWPSGGQGSGAAEEKSRRRVGRMAEVMSDFHGELNDVLSKVNCWALGREKDLLSLQAEHTSFLDTHNGTPARRPPPAARRTPHAVRSPQLIAA